MNRNRRKLIGKNTLALQLVREEIGKRIPSGSKIHINESLTAYGKRLLGKIPSGTSVSKTIISSFYGQLMERHMS